MKFKITFPKNGRSKFAPQAIEIAKKQGAREEGDLIVLELNEFELFKAYDALLPLTGYIGKWKEFRGYLDGVPVDPFRFMMKCHNIFECARIKYVENEKDRCKKCSLKKFAEDICPLFPILDDEKDLIFKGTLIGGILKVGRN